MEILTISEIPQNIELVKVSYSEAVQRFEEGESVFIKISPFKLIKIKRETDTFDFLSNMSFMIQRETFRDDEIIVTRHEILARYFREVMGINARWVQHARPYEIKDKDVFGVLPVGMMSLARTVTCVSATMSDDEYEFMSDLEEFKGRVTRINRYIVQCENLYVKEVESE